MYDIAVTTITGEQLSMERFRGRTLLIVNVASECGYTSQYSGLEALYRKYRDRGFDVLGFPCDQFGGQEPGTDAEIQAFCERREVSFPMFAKIDVNGSDAHPLFEFLKKARPGVLGTEAIKWNFTKFLVSPAGEVLERFAPGDTPESIEPKLGFRAA